MEMKSKHYDMIEEELHPHEHVSDDKATQHEDAEDVHLRRRLKITQKDLRDHGFSRGCPRCECHRKGQNGRASGMKHTEKCRSRIYEALKEAKSPKMENVSEDRVQTKAPRKTP